MEVKEQVHGDLLDNKYNYRTSNVEVNKQHKKRSDWIFQSLLNLIYSLII